MKFHVPIELLPSDLEERNQILQEYFCDQRAHSRLENDQWIIEPFWPPTLNYFVDPNINEGFRWWSSDLKPAEVQQQFRQLNDFQLSLNDSWTLFAWSKWLSKYTMRSQFPQEVIILHIDYHNDLMSPRIAKKEDNYTDLLTNKLVDMKEPDSVRQAILSGAIGVGSFMVPFLHEVKTVHIRHLCEGDLPGKRPLDTLLQKAWGLDILLDIQKYRPQITFSERKDEADDSIIKYKRTNNLLYWLSDLPNVPVLLHIDMDYFNCRYDGDSDWQKHSPRHDPDIEAIETKMEQIFSTIRASDLMHRIEDITIALSPGFFPVEFWQRGVHKMAKLIHSFRM